MTRWLVWMVALTLPAAAGEFTVTAPITLGGKDALHRLELPFEVHRDARIDLGDVRVLDGAGDEVPFAFAREAEAGREPAASVNLPIFSLSRLDAIEGKGSEITVRTADGALVSVKGASPTKVARRAAYLLDATALEDAIAALAFEWESGAGTEIVNVRVEASDDLRAWATLASGPLVHVEQDGRLVSQPRLEFAPRKAKYLRVTWDAPAFELKAVRAEGEARQKPRARRVSRVDAIAGATPGEWTYDLGARLPVEAIRLIPAQANDVIAATLSSRNDPAAGWQPVARGAFYRLQREGAEQQSPPLELVPTAARYWRAQATARAAPALEVAWRGREIVFVARGEGPFTLAFGDATRAAAALPLESLIPGYQKGAEAKLPLARAGEAKRGPPPSRWDRLVAAPPRRIALWAILVAGVALLGFMAWRLAKAD
jgi:hypothetical protein